MTTPYEYNNLPAADELNVDAVPEELLEDAKAAFLQALEYGDPKAQEVKAGYLFNRKDYLEVNVFGKKRNVSYSSSNDDVVLQMTIRIPNPSNRHLDNPLDKVAALDKSLTEYNLEAARKRLEAEIAAEDAAVEKAQAAAKKKREELEKLNEQ